MDFGHLSLTPSLGHISESNPGRLFVRSKSTAKKEEEEEQEQEEKGEEKEEEQDEQEEE